MRNPELILPTMRLPISHHRYVAWLGALYLVLWVLLAIRPLHRADWLLENVLVAVALLGMAAGFRSMPLSRISYTLVFLFLCLHTLGAHYTYSAVPYDRWCQRLLGFSIDAALGFDRNQFDRLVHFCYGLLLAYPVREMFLRVAQVRGFWGYFLPLDLTMSTSLLYELIEWAAALFFGGDLGVAYLGTQGDVWDAQKDMALASLGALLSMLLTAVVNLRLQRDFAAEWAESLRVKHREPLGEDAVRRLRRGERAIR